jgi:DnaK suppressor protein
MSDERHSEVLGGLPRTRPHRRSDKRAATSAAPATPGPETPPAATKPAAKKPAAKTPAAKKPAAKKPAARKAAAKKATANTPAATGGTRLRQPAQPDGLPAQPRATNRPAPRPSAPPKGGEILGTAVQAAAEIAEIGLSAGARAIRRAVSRLPRP